MQLLYCAGTKVAFSDIDSRSTHVDEKAIRSIGINEDIRQNLLFHIFHSAWGAVVGKLLREHRTPATSFRLDFALYGY